MRSSASALLAVLFAATACGNDTMIGTGGDDQSTPDGDACATSYLRYTNFGEPFALDWCRGCHSTSVPDNMRQKAPTNVNFDTFADVQHWKDRIMLVAAGNAPTMPPAGGPSDSERALLGEWLGCGAPQ